MSARLAVGTMNFGKRTPEPDARRIIDLALERGLTDFDTANLYSDGEAERVLGRVLGARREQVRLTTKVGAWRNEGLSKARVLTSLDESLARLNTGYVDVYLLHTPDPKTPLAQTLDGVAEVLASGKAKAWGVSNHAAWLIAELNHHCDARGLPRPAHSQVLYNAAIRQLDLEYFAFTRRSPIQTTVFNPLAGGLLARDPDQARPKSARLEVNGLYKRRYGSASMLELARALRDVAAGAGLSLVTLAYAWVLVRPGVDVVLTGPATVEHLQAALDAAAVTLSPDVLAKVDQAHRDFTGTDASYAR
jgi:aryl-alcohol dehydrogenase-like predicted oxidoreductase